MGFKKASTRFSIVFKQTDPLHLQVAEILNNLKYHSKAEYIAKAVLHYENYDIALDTQHKPNFNEKTIEAIVRKILRDRNECYIDTSADLRCTRSTDEQPRSAKAFNLDDDVDALGEDSFSVVKDAIEMFKIKR